MPVKLSDLYGLCSDSIELRNYLLKVKRAYRLNPAIRSPRKQIPPAKRPSENNETIAPRKKIPLPLSATIIDLSSDSDFE